MTRSKKDLVRAYRQFCDELSKVLCEEDPLGIGSQICTPEDEYDDEAAHLAADLKGVQ